MQVQRRVQIERPHLLLGGIGFHLPKIGIKGGIQGQVTGQAVFGIQAGIGQVAGTGTEGIACFCRLKCALA